MYVAVLLNFSWWVLRVCVWGGGGGGGGGGPTPVPLSESMHAALNAFFH